MNDLRRLPLAAQQARRLLLRFPQAFRKIDLS